MGLLKSVITQNINNFHQKAGNKNVIEFHGNAHHPDCLASSRTSTIDQIKAKSIPPQCPECGNILKLGFIFFGEMIPSDALLESERLAGRADVLLVISTSAVV